MIIGYIGLGKMGYNMCSRLLEKKWSVVAYNRSPEPQKELAKKGAIPVFSLEELIGHLKPPRLVWVMVAHEAVDIVLSQLLPHLAKGDTIIDGGNSPYTDSMRRAKKIEAAGIAFLDAGVSGGPGGARNGACVMVGGNKNVFKKFEKLFKDISCDNGYRYIGSAGAGHFVKMAHNGIEYGMMQSLAEGFSLIKKSPFHVDLKSLADLYNHGSVIESRLVGWLKGALETYGEELKGVSGSVEQSGEGIWTLKAGKDLRVDVASIDLAVRFRKKSAKHPSVTGKFLTGMRNQFGGHAIKK